MKQRLNQYGAELVLFAGYVFLCGTLLLLGERIPTLFPEETGYLGWAQKLLYGTGDGLYFLPGYSLFLLPVMAFSKEITLIYPWLLVVNVLMNGCFIVGVYRLSLKWGLTEKRGMLVSAAVSLYLPFVLYSQRVICECLLLACGVWLTVFLSEGLQKKSVLLGAGLLGILMLVTHSRMFILIPVCLIWLLLCYPRKKEVWIGSVVLFLVGVCCALFVLLDDGVTGQHFKQQLSGLLTLHGIKEGVLTLLSQSTYWILSTFGLVPAGIWYGMTQIRKKEKGWQGILFALLLFLGTALLSALYMSHKSQTVHILYGRYNDSVIAPLLLLGFLSYLKKRPPVWVWIGCLIPVGITAVLYREQLFSLPKMMLNVCGLYGSGFLMHQWDILIAFLFFIVVSLVGWGLFRHKRETGLVILLFLFLGQTVVATKEFTKNAAPPQMLSVLNRLDQEDLVLVTKDDYIREFFEYACFIPQLRLSEADHPHPSEGNVEISGEWKKNSTLIGAENGTFLYAKDETTAEKYHHLVLPADGNITEANSRIAFLEDTVRVTNLGSPWLSIYSVWDVQKAVRLGIRFYDRQGVLIKEDRKNFGKNMLCGDTYDFSFSWYEGAEFVSFELVQEFQHWFSELGDEGAITVDRQGNLVPCPEGKKEFTVLHPEFLISRNEKETLPDKTNKKEWESENGRKRLCYCHIRMPSEGKKELVVKQEKGDAFSPTLNVTLNNSVPLKLLRCENETAVFSLDHFDGVIETITIDYQPYNPFEKSGLPQWMSFLSLDSNLKPVQFLVHRVEDVLGKSINNQNYGIQIEQIELR